MIALFVLLLALAVAFLTVVLIHQNRNDRAGPSEPRAPRSTAKKPKP